MQTRRPGMTNARIAYVIDNWLLRGVYSDPQTGQNSWVYFAFVPSMDRLYG